MSAHKTGNKHSSLMDQIIAAAQKGIPKQQGPTFADCCVKIASQPPKSLIETMKDAIKPRESSNFKKAQNEMQNPPLAGENGGESTSLMAPDMMSGPSNEDMTEAKKSLVSALVALCGGSEQAIECISEFGSEEDIDESPDESEEGNTGDMFDDMIKGDLIDDEEGDLAQPQVPTKNPGI